MPKFEINQRVKISNPTSAQHGRLGIVVEINDRVYQVELDGQIVFCDEQSLQDGTFDWEVL